MNTSLLDPSASREQLIGKLRAAGIKDERILEAFRKVPRHLFVDNPLQAYDDAALSIGYGQTISQPTLVARMTELLNLGKNQKILEIGTGSGFQTAILAQFSRRVYTIERLRELGDRARLRLREMGYANVTFKVDDGSHGWEQHSPFDRIIVTAGAPVTPEALSGQLALGGIMVIPTGDKAMQELMVYNKSEDGLEARSEGAVAFVPLIGKNGWKE